MRDCARSKRNKRNNKDDKTKWKKIFMNALNNQQ